MNWNPYPLIVTGLRLKETNLNVIKETLEGRSRERERERGRRNGRRWRESGKRKTCYRTTTSDKDTRRQNKDNVLFLPVIPSSFVFIYISGPLLFSR